MKSIYPTGYPTNHPDSMLLPPCPFLLQAAWLRCYPIGFGRNLRNAWEKHVASSAGRRDLRFKPQQCRSLPLIEQFQKLPMGDAWEDAHLLGPLRYMFTSKWLRTGLLPRGKFEVCYVVCIYCIYIICRYIY